ncbi:hypothetical protein, partial [Salinispira pacifica]
EGAAKQVAPRLLLEALQNGAERVRTAASILKEARLWPSGLGRDAVAAREERVRRISIVLQGGVSPLIVSTLLEDSSGPNGSVALDRVLRLCETLVAVLQVARVPDPDLLSMAVTLLSSRLPEASFQSLPPLFVRGRVEGIDGATLAQTVTSIAARGGGIIQMDNEIRRLGGRR